MTAYDQLDRGTAGLTGRRAGRSSLSTELGGFRFLRPQSQETLPLSAPGSIAELQACCSSGSHYLPVNIRRLSWTESASGVQIVLRTDLKLEKYLVDGFR